MLGVPVELVLTGWGAAKPGGPSVAWPPNPGPAIYIYKRLRARRLKLVLTPHAYKASVHVQHGLKYSHPAFDRCCMFLCFRIIHSDRHATVRTLYLPN